MVGDNACLEVNARNRMGGYVGYKIASVFGWSAYTKTWKSAIIFNSEYIGYDWCVKKLNSE
jgi:hypothetical protein